MTRAQRIHRYVFSASRKQSAEYMLGVFDALREQIEGVKLSCPYLSMTPGADEYHSGFAEGVKLSPKK